jgi:hypothetical protein
VPGKLEGDSMPAGAINIADIVIAGIVGRPASPNGTQ